MTVLLVPVNLAMKLPASSFLLGLACCPRISFEDASNVSREGRSSVVEKFIEDKSIPAGGSLMTTSVKLNDRDKEKLERLQALVTLRTGEKITQQELLRILIGEALLKVDEFFDRISEQKLPMPDEEYERILSLVDDWRVETSWEDIDQILYGAKSRRK